MRDEVSRYLWSAREAKAEVHRRHLRVRELEARCAVLTGQGQAPEQARRDLMAERERELEAIREENRKYREVEEAIGRLSRSECRVALRLRYLRGLRWRTVQQEMERAGYYYSDREIFRLHGEALEEMGDFAGRCGGSEQAGSGWQKQGATLIP